MSKVMQKLNKIQTTLKAPKSQYNQFGGFSYRNCEDILESLKPLLAEVGAIVTLTDEVINIGSRFYIKATATFTDVEDGESISVSACAREVEEKTKMDASQITGSSSSYARKYALNCLFAIDDNKDADTPQKQPENKQKTQTRQQTGQRNTSQKNQRAPEDYNPNKNLQALFELGKNRGYTFDYIKQYSQNYYKKPVNQLTFLEFNNFKKSIANRPIIQ